jgi:hypothetical protein
MRATSALELFGFSPLCVVLPSLDENIASPSEKQGRGEQTHDVSRCKQHERKNAKIRNIISREFAILQKFSL